VFQRIWSPNRGTRLYLNELKAIADAKRLMAFLEVCRPKYNRRLGVMILRVLPPCGVRRNLWDHDIVLAGALRPLPLAPVWISSCRAFSPGPRCPRNRSKTNKSSPQKIL
jgi:hypothetical protein